MSDLIHNKESLIHKERGSVSLEMGVAESEFWVKQGKSMPWR